MVLVGDGQQLRQYSLLVSLKIREYSSSVNVNIYRGVGGGKASLTCYREYIEV